MMDLGHANAVPLEALAPDPEQEFARLAELEAVEYDHQREDSAAALNIRVTTLDDEVNKRRRKNGGDVHQAVSELFPDDPAWPDPVDGCELLDTLEKTIRRFCVMPVHAPVAAALWSVFAHAHDAFMISPLLALESPERRCGKTTALTVIGELVPRRLHTANLTVAVLFRVVEKYSPCLLIDEGDSFLGDNEEMRGVLNAGHNRAGAYVLRCVGDSHDPQKFNVWGPKAVALIGDLPETLQDRAIVVPLRRKKAGEAVERIRADRLEGFGPMRQQAARWAADNFQAIADCDPDVPTALNDRAADNWRCLIAFADIAGGDGPATARAAATALSAATDDEEDTAGVRLLSDCRTVFQARSRTRWSPTDLKDALCDLEEAPWSDWRRGASISPRGIAKLLKPYGIASRRDRDGRFYQTTDFNDACTRYLSS